jgi:hypothetical protein
LRDDDPTGFVKQVQSILHNERIRFHLKHVTLETIGSVGDPVDVELDLLIGCRSNGIALALIGTDETEAIRYCLSVNSCSNDEVLRAGELARFLRHTLGAHHIELANIVQRMIESKIDDVAKRGAQWAILTYLHCGGLKNEVLKCLNGTIPESAVYEFLSDKRSVRVEYADAMLQALRVRLVLPRRKKAG